MKKKSIIATLLTITMICSLAGCGGKETAKETTQTKEQETVSLIEDISDISTYVKLPDYEAYETTTERQEVTDDDIRSYINENILASLPITNRAAEVGDTVCIDYELTNDIIGTESCEDQYFTLGDGTVQEDFEKNLNGMSTGETKEFTFTYPEEMTEEYTELAGTEANVKATLKSIIVSLNYDTTTDEQIAEFTEYASKDELWNSTKSMLETSAQAEYEQNVSAELRQYILSESHILDIPESLIEDYTDHYVKHMDNLMKAQAKMNAESQTESADEEATTEQVTETSTEEATVEQTTETTTEPVTEDTTEKDTETNYQGYKDYLINEIGCTEYEYNEAVRETAKDAVREYLILEAVARQEEITATDEEISEYAERVFADYGYDSAEDFSNTLGRNISRMYVISEKITEKLAEN